MTDKAGLTGDGRTADEVLDDYVRRVVETMPPLSEWQVATVSRLLAPYAEVDE